MITVVIPVYKNSGNIPPLLAAMKELHARLQGALEVVFVVDGSPDDSHAQLAAALPASGLRAQLLLLSRNFGSFSAIRAGLAAGTGQRFAVMAADLQEPPELVLEFDRLLATGDVDVTIGTRVARNDPLSSRLFSTLFWGFYRRFIQKEIPPGGVDVFGCSTAVRDRIVELQECNSSLVGLLFWVGFRRATVPYERRKREIGVSAWTMAKKLRYLTDSVFSFSDLPIRLLVRIGFLGLACSAALAIAVLFERLTGLITVPGYSATVLTVVFFGALNCLGLGIIGNYVWRAFENTKSRPNYIVATHQRFPAVGASQEKRG
jgi:polyisoprenyl-phosphate glycosyltransferase